MRRQETDLPKEVTKTPNEDSDPLVHGPHFEATWGDHIFEKSSAAFRFKDLERWLMVTAMALTGQNQTAAAKLLGLNRDQVRYRMKKYGLRVQR